MKLLQVLIAKRLGYSVVGYDAGRDAGCLEEREAAMLSALGTGLRTKPGALVVNAGTGHMQMHWKHLRSLARRGIHGVAITEYRDLTPEQETRERIETRSFLLETPEILKLRAGPDLNGLPTGGVLRKIIERAPRAQAQPLGIAGSSRDA